MKYLLSSILVLLLTIATHASGMKIEITGKVTDNSGEPVAYATVASYRDTVLINAAAANSDGVFAVAVPSQGIYRILVTAVGYKDAEHTADIIGAVTDMGTIVLEQGVEIDAVVVSVQKKLITTDAEKMTYSVEDDPQSSSSTLEEIIRKIPQLSLDASGNVLLNGQSDYKILLNGHQASSLSRNFKDIIKSMPASQIKKIEVITNPSTKYDAEGAGGILNIITNKAKAFDGYNGTINIGTEQLEGQRYSTGANVSVQTGKFGIGISGYYGNFKSDNVFYSWEQINVGQTVEGQPYIIKSDGESGYEGGSYGGTLDLSYQFDSLNLVTFSGSVWSGRNLIDSSDALSAYDIAGDPVYSYNQLHDSKFKYMGGTIGLNYEHTFGKEGHTLTISDEIDIDPDDYHERRHTDWISGAGLDRFYPKTYYSQPTRLIENTLQIDYNNPLNEHHRIEAGVKHIYRNSEVLNTYTYDEETTVNTEHISNMYYKQHILGIYAGYGFTFAKWSGRLGARLERTWNDADVVSTRADDYSFRNRMLNVIPYASVTFIPKEGHNLSLSYTQRLQRPSIEMLSPGVDDTNPIEINYGNPELKAAVFNNLSLQYAYYDMKWSGTFALTNFFSNNFMGNYSFVDQSGIMNSTYTNDVRTHSYGFNGSLSYRPSTKLNLSFSFRGNYSKYDFAEMDIYSSRFSFGENINIDFAVWKHARIMVGQYYYSGSIYLAKKSSHYYHYYLGVKQKLFKEKLELTATIYNPFEKYRETTSEAETTTYISNYYNRYLSRSISVAVTYRFGKQGIGVKSTSRSIENDDMQGSSKGGGK